MNAKLLIISILIATFCAGCSSKSASEPQLVWSDEFNDNGIPNRERWNLYVGNGCPQNCGFGNHELQYYTDDSQNVKVENGLLVITAKKQTKEDRNYTSAKITSKTSFKYGRMEIRAKLPQGKGTWPALWMLPAESHYGGWPRSGEIDIMEHVGYNQNTVYGTVHTESFNHTKGTQLGDSLVVTTASSEFHEYAIEWREDRIEWFIDNEHYHTFNNTGKNSDDWPFDRPFYLIFNIAVGGDWGGKYGVDDGIWPQSMEVDYVRVYEF